MDNNWLKVIFALHRYKRFKVIEEHKKVVTVVLNKYTSSQAIEEEIMQMFQSLVFDEFYRSHSNKKLQCLGEQ